MNKKVLFYMIMTAVVVLAGWNVSQNRSEAALSDMALTGIEALAQESGGASCTCTKKCNETTTASCTGYISCNCHPNSWFVVCDGVQASC
ncbi:MAG: NVEALA domain-containing protein [Prevotellaceae bacterium]|jgi:hypothetical protein|nr:NVEALA domain-containing protein [Prevotellaceae bacterium]